MFNNEIIMHDKLTWEKIEREREGERTMQVRCADSKKLKVWRRLKSGILTVKPWTIIKVNESLNVYNFISTRNG